VDELPITVAETSLFIRQAASLWTDKERNDFIDYIAVHPEAGVIIPETGGVRKVRWGGQGRGKRGGTRIVYFFYDRQTPLYPLMAYAKNEREDMTPEQKQAVAALVALLKKKRRN
jgi:hypothetical protein